MRCVPGSRTTPGWTPSRCRAAHRRPVRRPIASARLAELATTLNAPLAEANAEHARGLADDDGELLDAPADRFADLGAVALAADAAAQAAREHAHTGHRGKELESSTWAHGLAGQGEVRTPAVAAAARPLPITDREREIATLVAAGLSNHQVADRLFVSMRTVDGHLYRIFAKLGIDDRDHLIHYAAWIGRGLTRSACATHDLALAVLPRKPRAVARAR